MPFSLTAAVIVALIVEGTLYGFSLALFGATIWAIIYKRSTRRINLVMSTATLALFTLSTMHVIVDARRVYIGCALSENSEEYFQDVANETFKNAIYEIETLLADAVLIYRCYIVWTKVWIILLPIIGWCGVVVTGTHTVWSIAQLTGAATDIFFQQTAKWVLSFYAIALATNFIATGLLAYKLWMANRETAPYRSKSSLPPVMLIILECGAIYSVSLLAMIIAYRSKTNGAYVMIDIIGQVIPITFYVITIRATMARIKLGNNSTTIPLSGPVYVVPPSSTQTTGSIPTKPVEVCITKFTDPEAAPYEHSK